MRDTEHIKKLAEETTKRVLTLGAWPVAFDAEDAASLPTSGATFTTGEHYKLELVGPNNAATLHALLEITTKAGIPVRRVVGTMGGLDVLPDSDVADIARIAKDAGVEFVAAPVSPAVNIEGFKEGKQPCEGSFFGPHLRGAETVELYLQQLVRGADLGLRTFLLWDFAAFDGARDLVARKEIPPNTTFKISIFAGIANATDVANWMFRSQYHGFGQEGHMITSANPVPLPIRGFGELRCAFPHEPYLDVHIAALDSMLGLNRIHEAHEIIRVASPVYAKIEQGANIAAMCDERSVLREVLPRVVASAQKFMAHMEHYPELRGESVKK